MKVFEANIKDIKPYPNNPRIITNEAIEKVANSIKEFGMQQPIVVDKDMVIIVGHTRLKACESLGMGTVPCVIADNLSEEQVRAYRLADNKTNEFSEWNLELLDFELEDLFKDNFDMEQFGFELDLEGEEGEKKYNDKGDGLVKTFIVPPFSVLDSRQGYWQDRKRLWKEIIKSELGRESELLGKGLLELSLAQGGNQIGTSIFDPVLCEILISWFSPKNCKIIDPFAGGSVRGIVSSFLGRDYYGVDLRQEQIDANEKNFEEIKDYTVDINGNLINQPHWYVGDSCNIDSIIKEDSFDFLLTCPPYADLEQYSDDPKDLSNMSYDDFLKAYELILSKSIKKLKDNAFGAIVVGDIRDKKGFYRGFIEDTKDIFKKFGMKLYNEFVLLEAYGTAALRAGNTFRGGRKVVKTHQNVLVFLKGDISQIMPMLQDFSQEIAQSLESIKEEESEI